MDPLTRNILLAGASEEQNGPPNIDILGAGGGGGGGSDSHSFTTGERGGAGGGGAGEAFLLQNVALSNRTLNITIGSGGAMDNDGGDTTIVDGGSNTLSTYRGGGRGGKTNGEGSPNYYSTAGDGGSGGGGGGYSSPTGSQRNARAFGSALSAYGNIGGVGGYSTSGTTSYLGGGGGGVGSVGDSAEFSNAGDGGAGLGFNLNGVTYPLAAGGSGTKKIWTGSSHTVYYGGAVNGVSIGGGRDAGNTSVYQDAVANTGSGGCGLTSHSSAVSAGMTFAGSDGIVVISYLSIYDEATVTGSCTHTIVNGYHFYEFTGDGTITIPNYTIDGFAKTVSFMAVGGGGGCANSFSGGGGAGEATYESDYPTPIGEVTITIGTGGTGGTSSSSPVNGGDTSISTFVDGIRTFRGGGSSPYQVSDASNGGCGSGATAYLQQTSQGYAYGTGGFGYVGFNGGNSAAHTSGAIAYQYIRSPGGGGGMGSAGENGIAVSPNDGSNAAGSGGDGVDYNINGRVYSVAAGGGARGLSSLSSQRPINGLAGSTPLGGFIAGGFDSDRTSFLSPVANTGSGGGAGGGVYGGGSDGLVVFSYPDSLGDPLSVTGTYTLVTTGGFRYYEFTGNGTIKFVDAPPIPTPNIDMIGIGAGGGGGGGANPSLTLGPDTAGGGGGGGHITRELDVAVQPDVTYNVTVGSGGTGGVWTGNYNSPPSPANTDGTNGGNTTFIGTGTASSTSYTWEGGGGGGGTTNDGTNSNQSQPPTPPTGGNQGGAGCDASTTIIPTYSGGFQGGDSDYGSKTLFSAGGGAGATENGFDGNGAQGGYGGDGDQFTLYGQTYPGGGGGGGGARSSRGQGGQYGGADGGTDSLQPAESAVDGTGGGGGGGGPYGGYDAGDGGDGLLVIAYSTNYRAAVTTGNVTYTIITHGSNDYRFYVFTAGSGTITF